ncbi:helix-turn-helix domain-containing protein [Allorhizobium sp. BGMRC 0089]|uniref:GlxA family transcriptional regulator n=1 Tax=Allorhizobium sonneratiae TaxID=2934936 RepID=UPI00203381CA|nr:helix-turn-helix domain-containing protein [Allorhizobium sonneratiae]MCM2292720.1 helix-turn-helix domain-containing protein [Allorhizobium sonneratiae]
MPAFPANPAAKTALPQTLVFLAYDGVTLLDLAGPMQVFADANALHRKQGRPEPYRLLLTAETAGTVMSDAGVPLEAVSWQALAPGTAHLVIVPGGPGVWDAATQASIAAFLKAQPEETAIASVCIGAFLLGHAGLLAGRKTVTHWAYCRQLQADFPEASVHPDAIFIRDGRIWSSAGVTAGIDLALALVEGAFGPSLAADLARGLVVYLKRSGGQSQYSKILASQSAMPDGRLADLHAFIIDNLHRPLPVAVLAERLFMSPRNFTRYYAGQTGTTPRKAVEALRMETAQRLLIDQPELSIKRIADLCGFQEEERMRRSFIRHFGVTPSLYRRNFGADATRR